MTSLKDRNNEVASNEGVVPAFAFTKVFRQPSAACGIVPAQRDLGRDA
jgi:hypothetical protein